MNVARTSRQGTPLPALTLIVTAGMLASGVAGAQEPELGFAPLALDEPGYTFPTAEGFDLRVDVVLRNLDHPFSLAFLPNGDALITERGKSLRFVRNATGDAALMPAPVAGAPAPGTVRGTGIAEVAVHPDFDRNRLVYFTFNRAGEPAADAAPDARPPIELVIARGELVDRTLRNVEQIYRAGYRDGGSGSRLAFGGNDMLYVSTGAPFGDEAQDPASPYGKVLRLNADGTIPADNPFADDPDARAEVYSMGHRDQLGLTVHAATGTVFAAEHGPNGGDEVNLILPGRDYGWPTYSFGRSYDGPRVSERPLGDETEQPTILWLPSIGITGLTFYTGDRLPQWRGNLFVGSARRGEIPGTGSLERVVVNDNFEELRRESLLAPLRQRIRDVRQGPDGLLYVLTDEDDGALLRLAPAGD